MRQRRSDRQRVGLKNWHHQWPLRQAQALVAYAAQLAIAIVAIALLDGCIKQRKLSVGFVQGLHQGLMAVVRSMCFGVMRRADSRQDWKMVRTACRDRHPRTRPQPQGDQAQQKAKEKATHCEIISQAPPGPGVSVRMTVQKPPSDKGMQAPTLVISGQKRLGISDRCTG